MTTEERIVILKAKIKTAQEECNHWKKDSDKNMCLDFNGYFEAKKELMRLENE